MVIGRIRWGHVGSRINPIRIGLVYACTPVVTLIRTGRSFRDCDVRGSGRPAVRFIVLCHWQGGRVHGWGRGRIRGASPVGERDVCLGERNRRQAVNGCGTRSVGRRLGVRLIRLTIRERIIWVLVTIVDDDSRVGPSQTRVLGLIQDVFPDLVPMSIETVLHVTCPLFVRRAQRRVFLPRVLELGRRSRIARVGVREWVVGECIFTYLGLRNGQVSHQILALIVPPMPSAT